MAGLQHFGWFLGQGIGVQGWGKPHARFGHRWYEPDVYRQAASTFETANFDLWVIKDSSVLQSFDRAPAVSVGSGEGGPRHDPLAFAAHILNATTHLGVLPTINASFTDPFYAARQASALGHLSDGRAGINVVIGQHADVPAITGARDVPILDAAGNHDRAGEWIRVIRQLWGDDTSRWSHSPGRTHDTAAPIDHAGRFYDVAGPGWLSPFPARRPGFVAPVTSGDGLRYAGEHLDIAMVVANTPADVARIRTSIHAAAAAVGRTAADITILPIIVPRVASSADEAEAIRLYSRTNEALRRQLSVVSVFMGADLRRYDYSRPFPAEEFTPFQQDWLRRLLGAADPFEVPVRDAIEHHRSDPGEFGFVGTVDEVADHIESFEDVGNDGFLINENIDPTSVHEILGRLVPELKRRGILRTEYGDGTLYDNLHDFRPSTTTRKVLTP